MRGVYNWGPVHIIISNKARDLYFYTILRALVILIIINNKAGFVAGLAFVILIIINNKEGFVGGKAPHLRGQLECWSPIVNPLPPPPHSQRVPLGYLVISVTLILPTHNPRFPPVVPLACWVVIRVFLNLLLILEQKTRCFVMISMFLSEKKKDADVLVRITLIYSVSFLRGPIRYSC